MLISKILTPLTINNKFNLIITIKLQVIIMVII